MTPRVSVVVAAYGRSNVLHFALETVRAQTIDDWEVVVVDDASPDDTSTLVESFGDPRMRTVRLAQNVGEQSGPNNVGVYLAAAPLVAFLNQDDLWFPDHLEHLLALHARSGAPIVYSTLALAWGEPVGYRLRGWRSTFHPRYAAPASSWLVTRAAHLRLGGWRPSSAVHGANSQDFLFRAWRAGERIQPSAHLSVLAEGSGHRPGSYRERHDAWQRDLIGPMLDDAEALRASILASAKPFDPDPPRPRRPLRLARWAARNVPLVVLPRLGISPQDWEKRRDGYGRGAYLAHLRTTRGLDAAPPGYEDGGA